MFYQPSPDYLEGSEALGSSPVPGPPSKFTAGNEPEATAAPEALLRAAHHPYPLSGAALSPGSPNSQRVVATGDIAT